MNYFLLNILKHEHVYLKNEKINILENYLKRLLTMTLYFFKFINNHFFINMNYIVLKKHLCLKPFLEKQQIILKLRRFKRRKNFKIVESRNFFKKKINLTTLSISKFKPFFKNILQSRKFLKYFFKINKIKSYKLTKIYSKFYNVYHRNTINNTLHNTAGLLLLKANFFNNHNELNWFFLNNFIKINNVYTKNYFKLLNSGDLISFKNTYFIYKNLLYFYFSYNKWFSKKYKKNMKKIKTYINLNKNKYNIRRYIKRWFYYCQTSANNYVEVEYRFSTLILFKNKFKSIYAGSNFYFLYSPLSILNNWYFKH